MSTANNFDSSSDIFNDQWDYEFAEPSGCFVTEIYLTDSQAQNLLGNSFDSNDTYSFVTFDFNEDNRTVGDDYFIYSDFNGDFAVSGSLTLTPEQTRLFGDFGSNVSEGTFSLSSDGFVTGAASPAFSPRSRGPR